MNERTPLGAPDAGRRTQDAGQKSSSRRIFRIIILLFVLIVIFRQAGLTPADLIRPGGAQRLATVFQDLQVPWTDVTFWTESVLAMVDTLAIAALGTAMALVIGLVFAMLGSRTVTGHQVAGGSAGWLARNGGAGARLVALLLRCVPEVIFASVLVRVIGLGPAAAILALGLAYGGMIAKVWGEQLETARDGAARALAAGGAGAGAQLIWARLPDALPGFTAYATYRFECAVRASAILGYVGGGGLGFAMDSAMQAGDYGRLFGQILVLIAAVAVVEVLADRVQRRLA